MILYFSNTRLMRPFAKNIKIDTKKHLKDETERKWSDRPQKDPSKNEHSTSYNGLVGFVRKFYSLLCPFHINIKMFFLQIRWRWLSFVDRNRIRLQMGYGSTVCVLLKYVDEIKLVFSRIESKWFLSRSNKYNFLEILYAFYFGFAWR